MNTLTFTVSELKTVLTGLSKVIPRHGLPILQHIRIIRDDAGIVAVHAMDLDCSVSYRFPQPIEGPIMDFLVPCEPLTRILRSSKGQVSLVPDKTTITVRTFVGQSPINQSVETKSVEEWPSLPAITSLPVPLTADAIKAIREAMDFASEDHGRQVLNGVCLDVSDKSAHYVVGTNGRALYSANSFKFALKEMVSIPTHRFWLWNDIQSQDGSLIVQPPAEKEHVGWLKFQFGDWMFITKQQVGPFPNWKQIVPLNPNLTLQLDEESVAAVLLAIPHLPDKDKENKPVTLRIKGKELHLIAGDQEILIPAVTIKGRSMTIRVNRTHLVQCLKLGLTNIELTDDLTPLVFHKNGKRAVVMCLRPAGDSEPPNPESEPETPPATEEPAPTKEEPKPMPAETKPATTPPVPIIEDVLNRVVTLKDNLKDFLRDLQEVYALLRQVEREKKATDKEIESIRAKLREIQSVKI